MKAMIQAKVLKVSPNQSKNENYNRDYPFLVDLVIPEVIEGERVAVPHTRIASKISLEKGEQNLEVEIMAGKAYELRFTVCGVHSHKQKGA